MTMVPETGGADGARRDGTAAHRATIGFLGPIGTFTEEAARVYAAASGHTGPGAGEKLTFATDERLVPFGDIADLLRATARGDVAEAIVPVENSIEGTVNITVDTLVHDVDLTIVADVVLPIRHHLLVHYGADWRRIRTVVSHPQALAQCRHWLDTHLPQVTPDAALSTAAAAEAVRSAANEQIAAIGNAFSANIYGLHIAQEDIQDELKNETRFFALRRPEDVGSIAQSDGSDGVTETGSARAANADTEGVTATGDFKTSVAFAFAADGPGNLYGALGEFARHDVNLTKLESRPARQALGHYIFFVDLDGHAADEPVAQALDSLRRECTFVKVLGSYRRVP